MTLMRYALTAAPALLLAACATDAPEAVADAPTAAPAAAPVSTMDGVTGDQAGYLYKGGYASPLWLSDAFEGTHERRFEGDTLVLTMDQTNQGSGGLDTALARPEGENATVAQVSDDLTVCFAYDVQLTGDGSWWAGPKISVNWGEGDRNGMAGWHETYVIEIASDDPATFEAKMKEYWDVTFLGETEQDGSTYRHFYFPFEEWDQYRAIRQDYRSAGATSIGPILDIWQAGGLPSDEVFDGVKVNIETYGPVSGTVRIDADIPDSYRNPAGAPCEKR